ncbi:Metallo-dependent phosphatase-like protein [Gaertneriomyces semiglobifer]|nr:Metallo-dependent phosphatase-like protein [Gaertneriomyces semiglobifer]
MRRTRLRAAAAQATIDPRQDPLNARTTTEEIPPTPDAQPNHAVIESSAADSDSEANVFKILLATDNHIGFMEKDPVRGMDSFDSFEEVLKLATESDVDFILLGGDLFHDNKPSRKSLHTTMSLLRKYCLGDRVCPIEFLSDQKENFPNGFNTVNYQDPNINVGLPVFSIHGNHDDPSGDGSLCALDLLSVAGLVNYFGKQVDVDDIAIKPLLLRKGTSKLALYGLGNVRDERLNRTFQRKNVKMYRPQEYADEWFNLMVIHQNRVPHGPNNHIPEQFLDDFLHLVLWGHEHECLVDPVHVPLQDFWITQPGSSVATSLCEGEATPKHVAILKIDGQNFNIEKVRLRSVRPFIIDEVCLKDQDDLSPADPKTVNQFLQDKVEELMEKALAEWNELNPGVSEQNVPKPLVRLKVEYSGGFTTFNPQRFGQAFVDKVANPKDILQFYRRRAPPQSAGKRKGITRIDVGAFLPDKLENFRVEDLVSEYLNLQNLEILPENELGDAVRTFVEKDDKDAIKEYVHRRFFTCERGLTWLIVLSPSLLRRLEPIFKAPFQRQLRMKADSRKKLTKKKKPAAPSSKPVSNDGSNNRSCFRPLEVEEYVFFDRLVTPIAFLTTWRSAGAVYIVVGG